MAETEFLADYEDEPEVAVPSSTAAASAAANGKGGQVTQGGQKKDYAGIHSSGFRYASHPPFVALEDDAADVGLFFRAFLLFFVEISC